jgi:hypothetical protein
VQRVFGPIGNDDLLRGHVQSQRFAIVLGDCAAQFGNAGGRRVVGVAVFHGLKSRAADVFRCWKVGLAEAEIENFDALGL